MASFVTAGKQTEQREYLRHAPTRTGGEAVLAAAHETRWAGPGLASTSERTPQFRPATSP